MKIGYYACGIGEDDPKDIVSGLEFIGYEAIGLCTAANEPCAPTNLASAARKQLKAQFRKSKVLPLLRSTLDLGDTSDENTQAFTALFELGRDLNPRKTPMIVSSPALNYPAVDSLRHLGDLAGKHDCALAVEPVFQGPIDSPDDAVDLLDEVDHPNVRLCFNVAAFTDDGFELGETVETCAPYAAVCVIVDTDNMAGEYCETMPGEGAFDYPTFLAGLKKAKYKGPIMIRIGRSIVASEGFDFFACAELGFETLSEARELVLSDW